MSLIDTILKWVSPLVNLLEKAFSKGFLYYIIFGIFIIGMVMVISFIYIWWQGSITVSYPENETIIREKAPSFCIERGYETWEWINYTELKFTCINSTDKNISLDKFLILNKTVP